MSKVVEDTRGKIRDLPITGELRDLLKSAAEACGVDTVRVTSAGQCAKGQCEKRTGSTRHDNGRAADLQLLVVGRALKFTDPEGQKVFVRFATEAARLGATGLGAGLDYMGDATMHVGFGSRAVWGAGGSAAKAPTWLRSAAAAGWSSGAHGFNAPLLGVDSPEDETELDYK